MQNENEVRAWFTGRLPDGWFTGPPDVSSDNDEILVRGELADVELAAGTSDADKAAARQARIDRFREETREGRMKIADEAERQFGRKVAWAAGCGGEDKTFTTLSIPVMTRLRMPERKVLDTLVEGGVARSRSEALAWCVRLVGKHQGEWIDQLREALVKVGEVRGQGPA
ncbi:MAG: hypothetical protein E6I08_14030 [Chloroflexi bacterium]|nr:MAG: hypothetical protein E6I08_14030 [Chloroflexota bacterium]